MPTGARAVRRRRALLGAVVLVAALPGAASAIAIRDAEIIVVRPDGSGDAAADP